jgi:hypothetical protein
MTLNLHLFAKHEQASATCLASVGNGIVCGRASVPGESLCSFHRTLFGPWYRAATKRAA